MCVQSNCLYGPLARSPPICLTPLGPYGSYAKRSRGRGAKELIIPHGRVGNRIITFVSQAQRRQVL